MASRYLCSPYARIKTVFLLRFVVLGRPLLGVPLLLVRVPIGVRVEGLGAEAARVQGESRVLGHMLAERRRGLEVLLTDAAHQGLSLRVVVPVYVAT